MRPLAAPEATAKLVAMRQANGTLRNYVQVAEISSAVARVRAARERLEAQGNPLRGKLADDPTRPSQQRLDKGDVVHQKPPGGQTEVADRQKIYQVRDPVELAKKYLEDDEIAVLRQFAVNAEYATRFRRITSSYEGASGGAFGPRHGGLPDVYRQAASIHEWVMQKMPRKWARFAEALAYGIKRERDGTPLIPREIVALFFPDMADKGRRDGGFIAMVGGLSWLLLFLEQDLQNALKGEVRGQVPLERMIQRERENGNARK